MLGDNLSCGGTHILVILVLLIVVLQQTYSKELLAAAVPMTDYDQVLENADN